MKIRNWVKTVPAALLAAGIWVQPAQALDIPLGDASFEDYTVPASPGYAYAADPNGAYRPTSAWIDDPDSAGQDDANSNWLYDTNYAENGSTARKRPTPRTGNQAMHGGANYNAQVTSAVFEAGKVYEFALWAQGDDDSNDSSSRIWMYIYDGSLPFSEPTSLSFDPAKNRKAPDTGDFVNRAPGMTEEESRNNWTEITFRHIARPGAPEIGNPVGVAFWGAGDGAVDDASLRVLEIPEPSTVVLLVGMGGLVLAARRRE